MYLVTLKPDNDFKLPSGTYCADNINAAESLAREDCVSITPLCVNTPAIDPSEDLNGKKILFVRGGGFGDLLFCTPAIREIKLRWPQSHIAFACFDQFRAVLENNPDIDEIVKHPMLLEKFGKFDRYVLMGDMVPDEIAHKVHAVDIVAQKANLELADKTLKYIVTQAEYDAAVARFPRKIGPETSWGPGAPVQRIGIQLESSARCRNWPRAQVFDFVERGRTKGIEIFLFGSAGAFPFETPKGVVNLTMEDKPLSIRESAAVLLTLDGFVGPDSSLVHIAGALGVPTIALYAAFPSELRTKYAPSIKAIDSRNKCDIAPCFHHVHPKTYGMPFPVNGPCSKATTQQGTVCKALEDIAPQQVWIQLAKWINALSVEKENK